MSLLLVEQRAHVAIVTMNRPESRNPLGDEGDGDEFTEVMGRFNADYGVRCVILTGAGPAFSAGGNVKEMKERVAGPQSAVAIRERYRRNIHLIARALQGLDVPLIAAVNGPAVGLGCDVTCMADIRIASDKARFGVTFLRLGLVPGDGGAWLLPRVIGMARASELLYTANLIDAATAAEWGLVNRVVPHEALMDEALALANRIAEQPPHSLRMAKALLKHGQSTSYDTLLEMSATAQAIAHLTEDHAEGVDALLEKRAPVFKGA